MHSITKPHHPSNPGFTLIEVLVSIAIIMIITGLILLHYGAFNSSILLKNQAYEIALDIREAQSYAVSVRGEGNDLREEYGLVFFSTNTNSTTYDDTLSYIFFQDNDPSNDSSVIGDRRFDYTDPSSEQVGEPRPLDQRFYIKQICVNSCAQTYPMLSITYKRPDFDARIEVYNNSTNAYQQVSNAEIVVANTADPSIERRVYVTVTGEVSVK